MDKIDSEQPLQSCSNNNKNTVTNGDGINGTNAKCLENKRIHNEDLLDQVKQDFDNLKDIQNFNRIGSMVVPICATQDQLVCEMLVSAEHVNSKGTLHGGQTATLTDIVTARAIGMSVRDRGMASIEISCSYFLPVKLDDTVIITANVLKVGRNVAFAECEFRRKSDGKLAAKGKHTVAILPNAPPVTASGQIIQY
ncbi:hypothetical protein WR25_01290 [Diploscapter pachys]|uniref:Acyl-coenzyme A thioesterase 13 n=1 Tax=Diploscapter pachys TaxID=2018661 RepID=A0A2A2J3R4_9BILA|nr:hypothetical protein WR25_01290 [Diploscapter pachys]